MSKDKQNEYRLNRLERQVKGIQRNAAVMHAQHDKAVKRLDRSVELMTAQHEKTAKQLERRIRDLEIRDAVKSGLAQNQVAKIYELTPGRVNQIVKKLG